MDKYRLKGIIEVIQVLPNGVLVQNVGDPSNVWIIQQDQFDIMYEKIVEAVI